MEDFVISSCGYFRDYDCRLTVRPLEYELQYIASGGVELEFGGGRFVLGGGSCWVSLPGGEYHYGPGAGYGSWEHRYVVFSGERVRRWDGLGLIPGQPCAVPAGLDFAGGLDRVMSLQRRGLELDMFEAGNLLENLFIKLRRAREAEGEPGWLQEVMAALNNESCASPDYGRLSARYGMSQRSFFRNFKRACGVTPHEYHLRTKVRRAMELLENTSLSIKETAERLGYLDVYYFSRQFKQFAGVSPGEFRISRRRTVRQIVH